MPDARTYSAAALANFFVGHSRPGSVAGDGTVSPARAFTAVELEQLVYAAHGVSLAFFSRPLLAEPVLAGEGGVEIPSLFLQAGKARRGKPVTEPLVVYNPEADAVVEAEPPDRGDREATEALLAVWERFERASCGQMIEQTAAADGAPWHHLFCRPGWRPGLVVPDALTERYFAGFVADHLV